MQESEGPLCLKAPNGGLSIMSFLSCHQCQGGTKGTWREGGEEKERRVEEGEKEGEMEAKKEKRRGGG